LLLFVVNYIPKWPIWALLSTIWDTLKQKKALVWHSVDPSHETFLPIRLESARTTRDYGPFVAVIFAGDFHVGLRLRYLVLLFFGGCVGVYVLAAFRVKPNVHGAVVDYFNFVKFKIAVREEIFFDDGRQVFFFDFDLAINVLSSLHLAQTQLKGLTL
jgi:hypothetical protein